MPQYSILCRICFWGVITDVVSIDVQPGKYVVAVSGGVDSMVLLDLLHNQPGLELIVAHFNHGIRSDSADDQTLVSQVAMSHNIIFESEDGHLGPHVSEEQARNARYNFLRHISKKYNAPILTAHHQDDLLETAFINMLRGTGWRGLSSLRSTVQILRPLLHIPKSELQNYAIQHQLDWREDSTNADLSYLRNYVRHMLVARMSAKQRNFLYQNIVRQNALTDQIDHEAMQWLGVHTYSELRGVALPRYQLVMMPLNVAHELLQAILRQKSGKSIERPLMEKALLFCKVAKQGKIFLINALWQIRINQNEVIVEPRSNMVS